MKNQFKFLLFTIVLVLLSSCTSGLKSYRKGDYYKACMESIDRLRSNPGSDKLQFILTNSYPLAHKKALREIENANLANEQNRYDILVYQYERINSIADAIYNCPKALELIPNPVEYRAELGYAKERAAEIAYNRGLKALNVGTIEQAKSAYHFFINANKYVNGYRDVLNKIEDAKYLATFRVLIQKPLMNNRFQYSADFFFGNLLTDLINSKKNRFIRFYTQEEAYQENMRDPHQIISLDFQSFSVGRIQDTKQTIDLKRDSVITRTVQLEGKTKNYYSTVRAKMNIYNRKIISGGVLYISIIDAPSNRIIQQRNFAGQYTWATEWGNYKGDKRALSAEQIKLCELNPVHPPKDQDLFVEFTKPIYNQTLPYLKSYYKNY